MSIEIAVLLFIGNAALFWLWASHLVPWVRELSHSTQGRCPNCGH